MVKEAILYVNSIVQLVNEDDNDTNNKNRDDNDDDYILPDFDLDYKPRKILFIYSKELIQKIK